MTDCAPVTILNGMKTAFETAVAAGTFSVPFDCRAGIVFDEKLPDLPGAGTSVLRPLVDLVLPVTPAMQLTGRYWYTHEVAVTVGLRQVLSGAYYRDDGTIDLDKIAPQLNLFYELIDFVFPSSTNLEGMPIAALGAKFQPPPDIVFMFHPELLQTTKQYCGVFRATFKLAEAGQ